MRDTKVTLITEVPVGASIARHETEVWAEKKSVGRTEFYQAYGAGLKASAVYSIGALDYEASCHDGYEPSSMVVDGRLRSVVRVYHDTTKDEYEVTIA